MLSLIAIVLAAGAAVYIPQIASVSTNSDGKELAIHCIDTKKPQVALSFDAASESEDLQTILDILAKHDVKATFFMTGQWVESYPDDVMRIYEAGHDLGNHGETHSSMSELSVDQRTEELMNVHEKVTALTGVEMELFRPPYDEYTNKVLKEIAANNYYTIEWSIDSADWKDYGADSIVQTVTQHKNLENGAIILMRIGTKYTKDALEGIITTLQDQGYELVPVSSLIYKDNYYVDPAGKQIRE